MTSQALERRAPAPLPAKIETPEDLALVLTSDRAQLMIAPFLQDGVSPAQVVAGMLIAVEKDPKLLKCTPTSLILAVAQAVRSGLDIGTTAHIVPFNTNVGSRQQPVWESRATFIADYKGIARLMIVCGAVRGVEMRCVYEKDAFRYVQGLYPELEHHPVDRHVERGRLLGAYVILRFPFGRSQFEYMTVEAVDEIRQKYSKQWKDGPVPPWYCQKTVLRQVSKLIPQETRFAALFRAVDADEREEFGELVPAGADGVVADDAESPGAVVGDSAENGQKPKVYSAPVRTPAGSGKEHEQLVAAAKALPFPFQKDKKNSLYGKPLGEISSDGLRKVATWIREKQDELPGTAFHAQTLRMIGLVLGDREREQEVLPLEEAKPTAKAGAPLAPGKVADALPKNAESDFPAALEDEEDGLPF